MDSVMNHPWDLPADILRDFPTDQVFEGTSLASVPQQPSENEERKLCTGFFDGAFGDVSLMDTPAYIHNQEPGSINSSNMMDCAAPPFADQDPDTLLNIHQRHSISPREDRIERPSKRKMTDAGSSVQEWSYSSARDSNSSSALEFVELALDSSVRTFSSSSSPMNSSSSPFNHRHHPHLQSPSHSNIASPQLSDASEDSEAYSSSQESIHSSSNESSRVSPRSARKMKVVDRRSNVKRGSYKCGKCGKLKKGHQCPYLDGDYEFHGPRSPLGSPPPSSPMHSPLMSPALSPVPFGASSPSQQLNFISNFTTNAPPKFTTKMRIGPTTSQTSPPRTPVFRQDPRYSPAIQQTPLSIVRLVPQGGDASGTTSSQGSNSEIRRSPRRQRIPQ